MHKLIVNKLFIKYLKLNINLSRTHSYQIINYLYFLIND